jgi:hypothetical protein
MSGTARRPIVVARMPDRSRIASASSLSEMVRVLHARDLDKLQCVNELRQRDIAETNRGDQTVLPCRHLQEWAAEDLTAILNDTGTFNAPWIQ